MSSLVELIDLGDVVYIAWVLTCFLLFIYLFVSGLERKERVRLLFAFLFMFVIVIVSIAKLA